MTLLDWITEHDGYFRNIHDIPSEVQKEAKKAIADTLPYLIGQVQRNVADERFSIALVASNLVQKILSIIDGQTNWIHNEDYEFDSMIITALHSWARD